MKSRSGTGPSEATEKWGVKTQKWGGNKQIFSENCLLLTNFALFSAKVGGGQLTPLPPCFRRPCGRLLMDNPLI